MVSSVPESSERPESPDNPAAQPGSWPVLKHAPMVLVWLALALLALPVSLQVVGWTAPLLDQLWMVDRLNGRLAPLDGLQAALRDGAWWRLITPVFLHFSVMHIAFNAVLFFVLGIRLELRFGSLRLLLVMLVWAVTSNLAQLIASGHAAFGGLSGVVSAMFGAVMVLGFLRPHDALYQFPRGFAIGMFVSLIIFSTGITEAFGLHVANAAHWAGLFGGVVVGGVAHLVLRQPQIAAPPESA